MAEKYFLISLFTFVTVAIAVATLCGCAPTTHRVDNQAHSELTITVTDYNQENPRRNEIITLKGKKGTVFETTTDDLGIAKIVIPNEDTYTIWCYSVVSKSEFDCGFGNSWPVPANAKKGSINLYYDDDRFEINEEGCKKAFEKFGENEIVLSRCKDYLARQSPLVIYGRNYEKCCCNSDTFRDKDCVNILWNAMQYTSDHTKLEQFQENMAMDPRLVCAIIDSRFMCGGPTCPGKERQGCSIGRSLNCLDELDDLDEMD